MVHDHVDPFHQIFGLAELVQFLFVVYLLHVRFKSFLPPECLVALDAREVEEGGEDVVFFRVHFDLLDLRGRHMVGFIVRLEVFEKSQLVLEIGVAYLTREGRVVNWCDGGLA